MRVDAISFSKTGDSRVDPLTGQTTSIPSTGTYWESAGCPAGQIVVGTQPGSFGSPDKVICGQAPEPPVLQEQQQQLNPVTIETQINPVFQQQSSPQVSPVIQTQSDSPGGSQGGSTEQNAPGGQGADTSQGISESELAAILEAKNKQASEELQAAMLAYQNASEAERQAIASDFEQKKAQLEAQISSTNKELASSGGGGGSVPSFPAVYSKKTTQQKMPEDDFNYWPYLIGGGFLVGAVLYANRKGI